MQQKNKRTHLPEVTNHSLQFTSRDNYAVLACYIVRRPLYIYKLDARNWLQLATGKTEDAISSASFL